MNCALFADDQAIWSSGRNFPNIVKSLQANLDDIAKWCDEWGMRVSTTKTVVVPFTKKRNLPDITLKLKGSELPVESKVKYLGVTFDTKLSYKHQIDIVHSKCKRMINLMRLVAGTSWGAQRKPLLTLCKAMVRPVLEYGFEAFYFAPKKYSLRLRRIQASALRICCGAMASTPICVLQAFCKEMPLDMRHHFLSLK